MINEDDLRKMLRPEFGIDEKKWMENNEFNHEHIDKYESRMLKINEDIGNFPVERDRSGSGRFLFFVLALLGIAQYFLWNDVITKIVGLFR